MWLKKKREVCQSLKAMIACCHLKKGIDFFHGSHFLGQGTSDDRCFVFKMSTKGPTSSVDLVNRMRRDQNADLK